MGSLAYCLAQGIDIDYGDYLLSLDAMLVLFPLKRYYESLWLAIPKYRIETSHPSSSPWRLAGFTLHRLYTTYSPREVGEAVDSLSGISFALELGAPIPVVDATSMLRCSSQRATRALLEKPEDTPSTVEALEALAALGAGAARLTGSHALSAAHTGSDIDVVIDGYYEAIGYVQEALRKPPLTPLQGRALEQWAAREALARGLDPEMIASLYRPWQRMLMPGSKRLVTVALVDSRLRRQPARLIITAQGGEVVRGEGYIEGYEPLLLDFPAQATARDPYGREDAIIVFDGIFLPRLFEGGRIRYRGLAGVACVTSTNCREAVLIGVREAVTYVVPA